MDWRQLAACRDHDLEIFFPVARHGKLPDSANWAARRVCEGCAVRADCLAWAKAHAVHGIWGGTTEKERRTVAPSVAAS